MLLLNVVEDVCSRIDLNSVKAGVGEAHTSAPQVSILGNTQPIS